MEAHIMSTETVSPKMIERLERRLDKHAEALETLRERQATQETDMVQLAGEMKAWRTEAEARDREHTASIGRVMSSMELTNTDIQALTTSQTEAFTSLQTTLEELKSKEVARAAVEADRKERAPGAGKRPGDANLLAARGWVGLIKEMPPWLVLVLLLGCIGFGVSLAIIAGIKYL
jgi:chromosome segregation ATPase